MAARSDSGDIAKADVDAFFRHRDDAPAPADSALLRALGGLRGSDDPAVTFSGLARASVPGFADGCAVELTDGATPPFRVTHPVDASALRHTGHGRLLLSPFRAGPAAGYPSYAGLVTHWRAGGTPYGAEEALTADLMVKHAIALIDRERLAIALARSEDRAATLALDAISGRAISLATGIIMHQRDLSAEDAENLLRREAADSSCRLADVVAGVVRARSLRSAAGPHLGPRLERVGADGTLRR